jgi:hypothetical protein
MVTIVVGGRHLPLLVSLSEVDGPFLEEDDSGPRPPPRPSLWFGVFGRENDTLSVCEDDPADDILLLAPRLLSWLDCWLDCCGGK